MSVHYNVCTDMSVHYSVCTDMSVHYNVCTDMSVHYSVCTDMSVHYNVCTDMHNVHVCCGCVSCICEHISSFFDPLNAAKSDSLLGLHSSRQQQLEQSDRLK